MSAIAPEDKERRTAEDWVEAFAEAWRAPGDVDAFAEHFEAWFTDDVRMVQPQLPTTVGKRAFREGFRAAFDLMPDLHATVRSWATDGDVVFIEFALEGTIGGRHVRMPAVDRFTLRDGLVSERIAHFDPTPLLVAVAASPRAWPMFLRVQGSRVIRGLQRGGGSR